MICGPNISCDPSWGRGELVSSKVGDAKVWLYDNGSFDCTLELHVKRRGQERFEYVIDKSTYSTLRLIKYQGRIMAANDKYIFAAYDPASDRIVGYHDLPFTIWEGQGEVLGSYKFTDAAPEMRRDFPQRTESELTN